jgi:transposase-like protein
MISVSDVLGVLNQIAEWKKLKTLPEKVESLEAKIASLESLIKEPPPPKCPSCGSDEFPAVRSRAVNQRTYICEACNYKEVREFKPK